MDSKNNSINLKPGLQLARQVSHVSEQATKYVADPPQCAKHIFHSVFEEQY